MMLGLAVATWLVSGVSSNLPNASRSFKIANDTFLKDDAPFNVRSGSLHYFRVPAAYWRDRLRRMKALGLNTVTMYVAWNYHEETEGQVEHLKEVTGFLQAANNEEMLVLFRPGPYICGEWEFGGLPAWLLWDNKRGIELRTYEPTYINAVERWWRVLLSAVSSFSYPRGGPIAMVQIENEYGSYGDCEARPGDAKYMNFLLDLATEYFGSDVVYTTIDGGEGETPARLESGSPWKGDARVLATVDGGLNPPYGQGFENQRKFNAAGHCPKMWSELWVGWFTVWRDDAAANMSSSYFNKGVSAMVDTGASFSLYMAHGGTNFGFWSGANGDQQRAYQPDITSYDYSSPISEAGDHNVGSDGGDLFEAVRSAIAAKHGPTLDVEAIPKEAYGKIQLPWVASLFESLDLLETCHDAMEAARFRSFEELKLNYGLVLYALESRVPATRVMLTAQAVHDRVQLFVDDREVGVAYRPTCPTSVATPAGGSMKLLVENMGRINYGADGAMYDHKGYLGPAPAEGNWTARCLPLKPEQVQSLRFADAGAQVSGPVFRRGSLSIPGSPTDTFLDMRGFTKGYVWVNGKNLGRYWETAGPQHTLYLPGPFLHAGQNEVIVLDLHGSPAQSLESVASPRYSAAATYIV